MGICEEIEIAREGGRGVGGYWWTCTKGGGKKALGAGVFAIWGWVEIWGSLFEEILPLCLSPFATGQ